MFCTGILCYGQAVIRCYAVVTAFYGNTSGICRSIVDSQDLIPGQAESRPGSTEGNRYIFFFIRIPVVVIISAENGCDSLVSSGSGYVSRSCADLQGLPRGSGGLLYRQDVSLSGFCLGKQDLAVSGSGIQVFRHLYCFARLVRGYPDVCR